MANVQLIEFTGKGRDDEQWHAANLLMFTKATRLNMSADLFAEIQAKPINEKLDELEYISRTVPSSWEFVDVTFLISGVTRATAQQITRTRTASYAMQAQRVVDVRDIGVMNPFDEEMDASNYKMFQCAANTVMDMYAGFLDGGMAAQDARGILPMNVRTNLVAKYNLRALTDLLKSRASMRVQGEYASIAAQMKDAVLETWPWVNPFLQHPLDKSIQILEEIAERIGVEYDNKIGWDLSKAIDTLRKV